MTLSTKIEARPSTAGVLFGADAKALMRSLSLTDAQVAQRNRMIAKERTDTAALMTCRTDADRSAALNAIISRDIFGGR